MSSALVHLIPFRGGHVQAIERDGKQWVVPRPVCEDLGLTWPGQHHKLSTLAWACVTMIVTQIPGDDQKREVFCVDLDTLLMWLATIHPNKVKPSARPALIAYQTRVKQVIGDYFLGRQPAPLDAAALQAAFEARLQEMEERHVARLQELEQRHAARLQELARPADPRPADPEPPAPPPARPRLRLPPNHHATDAERRLYDHRGDAEARLPFDYSRYLFQALSEGRVPRLLGALPGLYSRHDVSFAGEMGRDVDAFRAEFKKLEAAGLARADWSAPLVWLPPVRRLQRTIWPRNLKEWARGWDRLPECELLEEVRCDLWVWMHLLDTVKEPRSASRIALIEHCIGRRYRIQPHDGAPHLVPIGLGHARYAKPRSLLGLIDADLQALCPELHGAGMLLTAVRNEALAPLPRPPRSMATLRDEILELLSYPDHLATGLTGIHVAERLHRQPLRVKQELRAMVADGVLVCKPGGWANLALLYRLPQPMNRETTQ